MGKLHNRRKTLRQAIDGTNFCSCRKHDSPITDSADMEKPPAKTLYSPWGEGPLAIIVSKSGRLVNQLTWYI